MTFMDCPLRRKRWMRSSRTSRPTPMSGWWTGCSRRHITENAGAATGAMSTFTSMTVHCARCHDHKFDPIRQSDYYSLQAEFAGVDRADRPVDMDLAVFRRRRELMEKRRALAVEMRPVEDAAAQLMTPE